MSLARQLLSPPPLVPLAIVNFLPTIGTRTGFIIFRIVHRSNENRCSIFDLFKVIFFKDARLIKNTSSFSSTKGFTRRGVIPRLKYQVVILFFFTDLLLYFFNPPFFQRGIKECSKRLRLPTNSYYFVSIPLSRVQHINFVPIDLFE